MAEGRAYGLSCATLIMAALCSPDSRAGGEHDLARFDRGAPIPRSSWTIETTQPARKFHADSAHARPYHGSQHNIPEPPRGVAGHRCACEQLYWGNLGRKWVRTGGSFSMSSRGPRDLPLSLGAQPRSFGRTALRVVRPTVSAPVQVPQTPRELPPNCGE